LHDVAPPFLEAISRQLRLLDDVGIDRVVLQVVPRWHDAWPIDRCPDLVGLLQTRASLGSEVALHGLTHQPHGPLRGPALTRLRGRLFADGAAEFLSLTTAEAADAVREGAQIVEAAGLARPSTFCAPGWLISSEAERGCAAAGITMLAGMFSIRDLRAGHRVWAPSLGHMGTPYEPGVRVMNTITRAAWVPRSAVALAYLHPQRFSEGEARGLIERLGVMVARGWKPITYADLGRG
jgi:predicted deacetylase